MKQLIVLIAMILLAVVIGHLVLDFGDTAEDLQENTVGQIQNLVTDYQNEYGHAPATP